jgi:ATP-dependent RNA helicase DDX46/PRP5
MILQQWQERGSILIFVDKQSEADALFKELIRYGYRCLLLHGGLDPTDREFTIHDFKKGFKSIMVATSICSRGLDIKSIVLVINFQCPNHMEDYIHRIGRTGRAGSSGTAITFFTPNDDQFAGDLITALEKSAQNVPQWLRDAWKQFNEKVARGEAKVFHNRNRAGQGFKFNEEEKEKVR